MQNTENNGIRVNEVSLAAVAVKPEQYPREARPEFVFCGKSNVGKSSLINALLGRKSLARTSQTPGKTRTINFYSVENELFFVDLPGYGYAKIPRAETRKWGAMIERYLMRREQIRRVFFLVDIRHEPSAGDKMMFDWLAHYGYAFTILATKADKLKRSQLQKQLGVIRRSLDAAEAPESAVPDGPARPAAQTLIPFSSETKQGVEAVWKIILDGIGRDWSDWRIGK
ncbi:MAG: ribosome biogenesis GTP-binding protein YihA/YsxC [Firmicutes bacterium]|nr:ribosome biogenesis GTP-binding protein YihA/YsxC [Bacillota bacterium]